MAASDDENESGESEPFTITSEQGIEYDSTETLSAMLFQMLETVGKKGRPSAEKLSLLRSLLIDANALIAVNTGEGEMGVDVDDELAVFADDLPAGWSTSIDEDDDESE